MTFDLIGRVSTGANLEDHQRTREIVSSALRAAQLQLANSTIDNAYWDDAARKAYGDVDEDWVEETWGVATEDGTNYDAVFLVDRNNRRTISGYRKGEVFNPESWRILLRQN